MNFICKFLGAVDIASAILLAIFVPANLSFLKYILAIVLAFKGVSSLFG